MSSVTELHDQAMEAADEAFFARRQGDTVRAIHFSRQALALEAAAADLVRHDLSAEPTRSVLYRSAASLALECGELREAEQFIATALAGNPPDEIADELRDLLEQVHFSRHLQLRGIHLDPGEFQFSIAGNAVAYGLTLSHIFVDRIKDMEKIIFRTVERKLGQPFRERGAAQRSVQDGYSLYMTVPRENSFAVTLRLGRQMSLPGLDLSRDVVDEVLACFELLNAGQDEALQKRIPQAPYYRNFVSLAKNIAPDGENVSMVGLTSIKNGRELQVKYTRSRPDISIVPRIAPASQEARELVTVKGRLRSADALKSQRTIRLKPDERSKPYTIIVPEGMMNDIVRPLWDDVVVVTGFRTGNKIQLVEIDRAAEP